MFVQATKPSGTGTDLLSVASKTLPSGISSDPPYVAFGAYRTAASPPTAGWVWVDGTPASNLCVLAHRWFILLPAEAPVPVDVGLL
jgi:hypothetical protein